jgi:hypothetical protein
MTDKKRSGPSERQRAVWALAGVFVPAEGQKGRWTDPTGETHAERIVVTRVSPTGKTIWVRFLGQHTHLLQGHPFETALGYPYEREPDGSYSSNGNRSPYGELGF